MNIAYRFRIYPTEEQKILLGKTFGCCRFLYNQMLDDKIREYEKTKKMLKNTPAMYKREYPFLKEVDSLALANVQLHLEKAYKNFFRDPKIGFPRFKSKHHSRNSYTTNVVNGNILVESKKIRLPKLKWIAMKKHREPAEGLRLKSVTVSMEPSGKYFASLLYEGYSCENQAAEPDYSTAKILGIDYAMQGMAVFSEKIETEEAGFFRKNEKRLRGSSESCQDAYGEAITMNCRKRKLPDVMKRYETSEEIICTNSAGRSQTVMMQLRWKISI